MIPSRVCILTAGRGTRLGKYAQLCNKALLPLGDRAIISRILEKFPVDWEVVVALGDRGAQVCDYLLSAHPKRRFVFVEVDRWEGEGTGPGYSLECCRPHLLGMPFYFVASDTLWEAPIPRAEDSWMAVAGIPAGEPADRFCCVRVGARGKAIEIRDKQKAEGAEWKAFTGLGWVAQPEVFFDGLARAAHVRGEKQVSSGFQTLLEQGRLSAFELSWKDVGTEEAYRQARGAFQEFDFSKTEEIFYFEGTRIVKFFGAEKGALVRAARARLLEKAVPSGVEARGQFLSYERMPGDTFYRAGNSTLLPGLLDWLSSKLWKPVHVENGELKARCRKFYEEKTRERVAALEKKWGAEAVQEAEKVRFEGAQPPSTSELLAQVPWKELERGKAVRFHGDLQFDNVIRTADGYTLVDWRTDFAGAAEWGDLHYDLAKLLGGIRMNYAEIKRNRFGYREEEGTAFLEISAAPDAAELEARMLAWVRSQGVDWARLEWLVALIYLNMAPLHHAPFDRLLFVLARKRLWDLQNPAA